MAGGLPSVPCPRMGAPAIPVALATSRQPDLRVFSISGVTRDSTGAALGNCVVSLFDSSSNVQYAQTVSDGSGNFSFVNVNAATNFFLLAQDQAGTVFGTTLDSIVGL